MELDTGNETFYGTRCNNCNEWIGEGDDFCSECGASIDEVGTSIDYEHFYDDLFEDEKTYMAELIEEHTKSPYKLVAKSSNWLCQTGYKEVATGKEAVNAAFSFGGSFVNLVSDDNNTMLLYTASHDRPTGFYIQIHHALNQK